MKKPAKPKTPRTPAPKSSGGSHSAGAAKLNQATTEEFEQEGMGVAAKE